MGVLNARDSQSATLTFSSDTQHSKKQKVTTKINSINPIININKNLPLLPSSLLFDSTPSDVIHQQSIKNTSETYYLHSWYTPLAMKQCLTIQKTTNINSHGQTI